VTIFSTQYHQKRGGFSPEAKSPTSSNGTFSGIQPLIRPTFEHQVLSICRWLLAVGIWLLANSQQPIAQSLSLCEN